MGEVVGFDGGDFACFFAIWNLVLHINIPERSFEDRGSFNRQTIL